MSVEFFHFFKEDCSEHVDIRQFESDFKKELRYGQSAKVYMIHQPFLNNLLDVSADLILIIAIENKDKNFYIVKQTEHKDKNNELVNRYLHNVIIPIKFVDEFRNDDVAIYNELKNYHIRVGQDVEINYRHEIQQLKYQTEKYFQNVLGSGNKIKCIPIMWILSDKREKYCFPKTHLLQAYRFGVEELMAFLKFGSEDFFKAVEAWGKPKDKKSYQIINQDMDKIQSHLEKNATVSPMTKKKIDRIAEQHHQDAQIYERYLAQNANTHHNEFELNGDVQPQKRKLPARIRADKNMANHLVLIQGKAGSGKTTELLLLIKKQLEQEHMVRYITYNKLLKNSISKFQALAKFKGHSRFSARTIHGFMYDVGTTMGGVCFIMGAKRVAELSNALKLHIEFIEKHILGELEKRKIGGIRLKDLENANPELYGMLNVLQNQHRHEIARFHHFIRYVPYGRGGG